MTVKTTLTRQELYDRVWQTPMVKIAAEYGISGRGLAKLCERHGIPVPGRGHWAIKKAGYEVEPDPLPADPSPDTPVQVSAIPIVRRKNIPTSLLRSATRPSTRLSSRTIYTGRIG